MVRNAFVVLVGVVGLVGFATRTPASDNKPVSVTKFDKEEVEFLAGFALMGGQIDFMKGLLDSKQLHEKVSGLPSTKKELAAWMLTNGVELVIDAPAIEDVLKKELLKLDARLRVKNLDEFIAAHHGARNKGTKESKVYFARLLKQQKEALEKLKTGKGK